VSIGLSFRDHDGRWCRTFALAGTPSRAGMACRDADRRWQLSHLVDAGAADAGLRQAATAMPPAVLVAVDARIAGEPLDAEQERRARDGGWR
jgi:hypothetical protein